jgi:hypothetical protein
MRDFLELPLCDTCSKKRLDKIKKSPPPGTIFNTLYFWSGTPKHGSNCFRLPKRISQEYYRKSGYLAGSKKVGWVDQES